MVAQAELFSLFGHPDRTWVILPGCDHAAHLESCAPRFVEEVAALARRAGLVRGRLVGPS